MTATVECPKCHGAGRIAAHSNVLGGVCFRCEGTKVITAAAANKAVAAAKRTAARKAAAAEKVRAAMDARWAVAEAQYGDDYRLAKAISGFDHPVAGQAADVMIAMRDGKSDWVITVGIPRVLPQLMTEFQLTGMSIGQIEAQVIEYNN
jgi:hypothetical protein